MKRIIFAKQQKECLFLDVYSGNVGLVYDPEENPFAREVFCVDASNMPYIEEQMSLHGFRRMYNIYGV
jgi:hypothetical protein